MPEGPTSFSVVSDPRCNLACASCRQDHIFTIDDSRAKDLEGVDRLIEEVRPSLEILKLAGDGEVFFSPWLRSLVKRINRESFPRFRFIYILSNGLLFDEKTYRALMPGSQFIKQVSVSVDAGNEETYRRVRGGDWSRLLKNLRWLGECRAKKMIPYFQINFTVRAENFESIPDFVRLGREVGASNVKFTAFFNYETMAIRSYEAEAIHLPSHPRHQELAEVWKSIAGDKSVRWSMPVPGNRI